MNRVFEFLDCKTLYKRCVLASVAHAIMVGKYNLLSAEQSWDGINYNFQNMEDTKGVISFDEEKYVCVIQNSIEYESCNDLKALQLLHGAKDEIMELAKTEAFQYMQINQNGTAVPFVSVAFWGDGDINYSNQTEEQLISCSQNTILPFLYSENDAIKYWRDYYEMSEEQVELMKGIYIKRLTRNGRVELERGELNRLKEWFGDISECIESFQELDIF